MALRLPGTRGEQGKYNGKVHRYKAPFHPSTLRKQRGYLVLTITNHFFPQNSSNTSDLEFVFFLFCFVMCVFVCVSKVFISSEHINHNFKVGFKVGNIRIRLWLETGSEVPFTGSGPLLWD